MGHKSLVSAGSHKTGKDWFRSVYDKRLLDFAHCKCIVGYEWLSLRNLVLFKFLKRGSVDKIEWKILNSSLAQDCTRCVGQICSYNSCCQGFTPIFMQGIRKRWTGLGTVAVVDDMCSKLLLYSALSLQIGLGKFHC